MTPQLMMPTASRGVWTPPAASAKCWGGVRPPQAHSSDLTTIYIIKRSVQKPKPLPSDAHEAFLACRKPNDTGVKSIVYV